MAESSDLKVFISWSGELARQVALALHELLPVFFDVVKPWMSDEDIDAGARGLEAITRELDDTRYGIIVVTRENQRSQWLNFEAGALSKKFENEGVVRVAPLLVDMEAGTELTGPLVQFQWKQLDRAGFEDLLVSIGKVVGVTREVVQRRIVAEWEPFKEAVDKAIEKAGETKKEPPRTVQSMFEEILTVTRSLAHASAPAATRIRESASYKSAIPRFLRASSAIKSVQAYFAEAGIDDVRIEEIMPGQIGVWVSLASQPGASEIIELKIRLDSVIKRSGYVGQASLYVNDGLMLP
jgi:hypothetical protein